MLHKYSPPQDKKHILQSDSVSIEDKMNRVFPIDCLNFSEILIWKNRKKQLHFLMGTDNPKNKDLYRHLSLSRMKPPARHKKAEGFHWLLLCKVYVAMKESLKRSERLWEKTATKPVLSRQVSYTEQKQFCVLVKLDLGLKRYKNACHWTSDTVMNFT